MLIIPKSYISRRTDIVLLLMEAINIIFDLPSARQNFLWYHAAAGFPPKETFIRVVCNGNYATWPKLTVQLIHKYMPDLDESAKGHLKGQHQGVRSTKQKAFKKMIKAEEARMKIEGESLPFCPLPPTKFNDIFVHVEDLNKEIHTNQTGAFPHTSQRGNLYIMVAVHLDVNYIFAKYEEQDGGRNDQGLPKDSQQNESSRVRT